jgi:beta-lactamase regulating signal transducer with metallopeptidase domain
MDTFQFADSLLNVFIDIAAKGVILLTVAFLATLCMKRSTAALRHSVWSMTFLSLLLLPVAVLVLPAWQLPLLPAQAPKNVASEANPKLAPIQVRQASESDLETSSNFPNRLQRDVGEHQQLMSGGARNGKTPQTQEAGKTVPVSQVFDANAPVEEQQLQSSAGASRVQRWVSSLIVFIWFLGAAISGVWLSVGIWRTMKFRRQSETVVEGVWCRLCTELRQLLKLRREVRLCEHTEPIVPLTWGVLRPVVLLPKQARTWDPPVQRTVLLHELAHIQRGDVAFQLIGRIACAIYWFNPLMWIALRWLRQERELACDDAVVRAGEKASDYAERLLQVARLCNVPRGLSPCIAMAEGNSLELRIKSLFDSTRGHGPMRRAVLLSMLVVCGLTLTAIAMIQPVSNHGARDGKTTQPVSNHGARDGKTTQPVSNQGAKDGKAVAADDEKDADEKPLEEKETQATDAPKQPKAIKAKEAKRPFFQTFPKEWTTGVLERIVQLKPVFGKEEGGLKLGVAYVQPNHREYKLGQTIPTELFLLNVGKKEKIVHFKPAPGVSYAPKVVNAKGKLVRGITGMEVYQPAYGVPLKPGQACRIPLLGLELGKGTRRFARWESPALGDYKMSYIVGTLKTGLLEFRVEEDGAESIQARTFSNFFKDHASPERIAILKPVFGKPTRGIALGVAFGTLRQSFAKDETIPLDLFFHNVSDKEVSFHFLPNTPTVSNAEGARFPIVTRIAWIAPAPHKFTLQPGETRGLPTRGLVIGKSINAPNLEKLAAGKYTLSFQQAIGWNGPEKTNGRLASGTLKFDITKGQDNSTKIGLLAAQAKALNPLDGEMLMKEKNGLQTGFLPKRAGSE